MKTKKRALAAEAELKNGRRAAVSGSGDWDQKYLMATFMHPEETGEPGAGHMTGYSAGIVWGSLPLHLNTQGSSLADVSRCMGTDKGADDLASELGLDRAFTQVAKTVLQSALADGIGLLLPEPPDASLEAESPPPASFIAVEIRDVEELGMGVHLLRRFVA